MKWSLYNFIIRNDSNYLLYNSLSNELMACVGAINSLLNEYKNNIDELKQIHPELYNYLMRKSSLYQTKLMKQNNS